MQITTSTTLDNRSRTETLQSAELPNELVQQTRDVVQRVQELINRSVKIAAPTFGEQLDGWTTNEQSTDLPYRKINGYSYVEN